MTEPVPTAVALPDEAPPTPSPPSSPPSKLSWRRVALVCLGLFAAWLGFDALTWPDVAGLGKNVPKTTAFIERYRRGPWMGLGPDRKVEWKWVSGSRISSNLKRAVIVSEDIEFFSHNGFSTREQRAALEDAWE